MFGKYELEMAWRDPELTAGFNPDRDTAPGPLDLTRGFEASEGSNVVTVGIDDDGPIAWSSCHVTISAWSTDPTYVRSVPESVGHPWLVAYPRTSQPGNRATAVCESHPLRPGGRGSA